MRRADDIDAHVGAALRARRIEAGMTQQQFAEAIGVTYQQAHKYETCVNRITASRLWHAAQALGCTVDTFFADLEPRDDVNPPDPSIIALNRHFAELPPAHRLAVRRFVAALANGSEE